jgi:hypothetical protein
MKSDTMVWASVLLVAIAITGGGRSSASAAVALASATKVDASRANSTDADCPTSDATLKHLREVICRSEVSGTHSCVA